MPRLVSVATAVPATRIEQSEAATFARAKFAAAVPDIERLMPLFTHAGIDTRYFAAPQEWFFEHHDLAERSALYVTEATRLSEQAATAALEQAHLAPADIDYIIYVNTTGLATPSIDARLINRLGMRTDTRRTPIWGLGCAGGVAGLSHAFHYALAHPRARILVVSTELCGLTFLPDDMSKSNLVATALFGDGAAAAVVSGDDHAGAGLEILGTRSRLYPDSYDVMGWTVLQEGLQVGQFHFQGVGQLLLEEELLATPGPQNVHQLHVLEHQVAELDIEVLLRGEEAAELVHIGHALGIVSIGGNGAEDETQVIEGVHRVIRLVA